MGLIDNKAALVQVMAWRRTNDDPVHWHIYAALGGVQYDMILFLMKSSSRHLFIMEPNIIEI